MTNADMEPNGTWTGREERIEDRPLIKLVPPKGRLTLSEADKVLKRMGEARRR